MRHLLKLKKLNRTSSHRKAMFVNMAVSLLKHEQIKTTLPKAKALRPIVEKLITKAKTPGLSTTRYLVSKLRDQEIVKKLSSDIAPRNASRNGGYTRILKAGFRTGDVAPMAVIQLVEKAAKTKPPKKELVDKVEKTKEPKPKPVAKKEAAPKVEKTKESKSKPTTKKVEKVKADSKSA